MGNGADDWIDEPPHDEETERAVLGACFLGAVDVVRDQLTPTDFYRENHRKVFRAICELADEGEGIDVITVGDRLEEKGELESVGGASFLTRLSNEVPSTANAEHYVGIVARESDRRELQRRLENALESVGGCDPEEFTGDLADELLKSLGSTSDTMGDAADCIGALVDDLEDDTRSITTGYTDLDELFEFEPGRLYLVAGRTGTGKSAMLQNMTMRLAGEEIPTAMFSAEMRKAEIAARYLAIEHGIDADNIDQSESTSELYDKASELTKLPWWVDADPSLSLARLRARARRLREEEGVEVVFVDYLQLLRPPDDAPNDHRERQVAELSRGLKRLAGDLEMPVVAAVQLRRKAEDRRGGPKLRDLRYSGSLEQDADVVAILYQGSDDDEDDDGPPDGATEVLVRKNRSGETGSRLLKWTPEHTRFEPYSERENLEHGF